MKNNKYEKFHNRHETFSVKAYGKSNLLPDRYVLILTNLCNLRCPFCFQKKIPRKDAMKASDWINFIKQLPPYSRVTLTGGEPLIFPGFKDVFDFAATKFDCNIISNGLALSEKTIDYILSYPKFKVLSLSIDDIGNKVRNLKDHQWKHIEKMIGYFVDKKNRMKSKAIFDIKTVVLDGNAENLFEIHRYFVERLRVDTHMFQLLKGSPIQHADYMFTFADIKKRSKAVIYKKFETIVQQLELIKKYDRQNKKISFMHPRVALLNSPHTLGDISYINNSQHIRKKFLPCKFPWSSMHINYEGTVFPCLAISMGNVKNEKLKNIWSGSLYSKFRKIIKSNGTIEACNRCGWLRPAKN